MSEDNWKQKILQERLGGKTDWTDSERIELSQQLDRELEEGLDKLIGKKSNNAEEAVRPKDAWTEENWQEVN